MFTNKELARGINFTSVDHAITILSAARELTSINRHVFNFISLFYELFSRKERGGDVEISGYFPQTSSLGSNVNNRFGGKEDRIKGASRIIITPSRKYTFSNIQLSLRPCSRMRCSRRLPPPNVIPNVIQSKIRRGYEWTEFKGEEIVS